MGHHDAPEKCYYVSPKEDAPPPMLKKTGPSWSKLLVGWSKIVGSVINFAINFTILQKKYHFFFKILPIRPNYINLDKIGNK